MYIRPFTSIDLPKVISILQQTDWGAQYIAYQKELIDKLTLDKEGEVLVCIINDEVVGFIQVTHHKWNKLSYVHGLLVDSKHLRLGVATTMLKYVEESSKHLGNRGIYLDTSSKNSVGKAFYVSMGYTENYLMPKFYEPDLDAICYIKFFN